MRSRHQRVLWLVLTLNLSMFAIESVSGIYAHSTALLADALDMFGDALVYAFSLFVLAKSAKWQAGASFAKAIFMLAFGIGVLTEAAYKIFVPTLPNSQIIGIIGSLALVANLICFFSLYTHRSDNLNMKSTWLCSRNDLIANVGIIFVACFSYLLHSRWPDIIVGSIIAWLFLHSALSVFKQSLNELHNSASTA